MIDCSLLPQRHRVLLHFLHILQFCKTSFLIQRNQGLQRGFNPQQYVQPLQDVTFYPDPNAPSECCN